MKTHEKKTIPQSLTAVLAVLVLVGCLQSVVTSARGDSISLESIVAAPASNTIDSAEFTDWALGSGNRKAGGSQISVLSTATWTDPGYPAFTYSDGTSPVSATNEVGTFRWDGGNDAATGISRIAIHATAGSTGTVTLLVGGAYWADLETSFSPTGVFTSGTGQTNSAWQFLTNIGRAVNDGSGSHKVVLTYASSTAQDLDILLNGRGDVESGNAGFWMVGVTAIPEPSTLVLLTVSCFGLLAYAWRKRK